MAHRSKTEAYKAYDDGTPRICMDYFYMNERDREEGANPLVVVTDEDAGDKKCPRCWTQRCGRARRNGLADPRHFP